MALKIWRRPRDRGINRLKTGPKTGPVQLVQKSALPCNLAPPFLSPKGIA